MITDTKDVEAVYCTQDIRIGVRGYSIKTNGVKFDRCNVSFSVYLMFWGRGNTG